MPETGRYSETEIPPSMLEAVKDEIAQLDPEHFDLHDVAVDAIKAVLANLAPLSL